MDKFELELLAQLKEHNRLMKELVKIEQDNFELSKDNRVNSDKDWVVVESSPANQLGTYCGVNTEIFSAVKVRPAHWISNFGKTSGYDIDGHRTWYIQIMCSNCGFKTTAIEGHTGQYSYCPNCGMEMEKGGEEDERSYMP